MQQKKILLWDFDNTLAYRKGMWGQTAISLLHKRNITQFSSQDISPYLQRGFPWHEYHLSHQELLENIPWWEYITSLIGQALRKLNISESLITSVLDEYREEYLDVKQWYVFDDTISALERMKERGFEQMILSNHVPELHEIVEGLNLAEYFTAICSSANIGYEKPHRKIFEYVLNTTGRQHVYIMIGDSYHADILGAQSVNIPAILVRKENVHQYPSYRKDFSGIDATICDLFDEQNILCSSNRSQER